MKMTIKSAALIIFILASSVSSTWSQRFDAFNHVKLELKHHLRINCSALTIEIDKYSVGQEKKVEIKIQTSEPLDVKNSNCIAKDTSFLIDESAFAEIMTSVNNIFPSHIYSTNTWGDDGSTWKLSFGDPQNFVTYTVWTPQYSTNERKIQSFVKACIDIMNVAKLDSEKITKIY